MADRILLFSTNILAQHSAGGGGSSSGASSGGGGGGSHGGSSAGSFSSASSSSHSSGGSVSHRSTANAPTSGSASSRSGVRGAQPKALNTVRQTNAAVPGKTEPSQKRGFFSFLRHPFRKPLPPEATSPPLADLRRPVCFKGPCQVCPKGGCAGTVIASNSIRHPCAAGEFRSGGACLQQISLDDCSGLRMMAQQQAQRMQAAEATRQSACSSDPHQCSASSSSAESEANLYRELQARYQACQRRAPAAFPFNGFGARGYSAAISFDSVR